MKKMTYCSIKNVTEGQITIKNPKHRIVLNSGDEVGLTKNAYDLLVKEIKAFSIINKIKLKFSDSIFKKEEKQIDKVSLNDTTKLEEKRPEENRIKKVSLKEEVKVEEVKEEKVKEPTKKTPRSKKSKK